MALSTQSRRLLLQRSRAVTRAEEALEAQRILLRNEIVRAHDDGASYQAIASVVGISKQRAIQLAELARASS